MYARLVTFNLGPGMRSKAEQIADEMIPVAKGKKGLKDVHFLADVEGEEYGALLLWETREDAEAGKEALFPILQGKLSGIAKGPPSLKLYEVYEP
jgi:heme-degrading monooxygenase HmoA